MLDNLTTQVNLAWDKAELESISDQVEGFDVGDFGFELDNLPQVSFGEDTTKHQTNTEADNVQEDEFDENTDPIEHRVTLGDIWQLGNHRLMCGDSCDIEQVKKLCGGQQVDCWLTDPPYNVALGYEDSASEARQRHRRTDQKVVLNDSMPDADFRQFLVKAYTAARESMKPGAAYYIFHADNESYNFRGALRDVGDMQLRQTLIWVKDTITLGRQDYQWKHEPCLYGWKEGAAHKFFNDRKQSTCIEFPRPKRSEEHPTMKPVPLFAYLMANSTEQGDLVLDSFGGSGTTLIAAEQLNRKACLMELSPVYCDVIIARWEKLTGNKAQKIASAND
jgi:site-specific DNA-methyltransferase (adenine-specific)